MSATTLSLRVSNFNGQTRSRVSQVPRQSTIGEFVKSLLAKMSLPEVSPDGRPLAYQARLEREGRHVHSSEVVGDALRDDDEIMLTPSIDAGGH
jgi:hypothetical protein